MATANRRLAIWRDDEYILGLLFAIELQSGCRHITSTLSLDIQNLTNNKNIYNQTYDAFTGKVVNNYQTGFIPVLNYKIDF